MRKLTLVIGLLMALVLSFGCGGPDPVKPETKPVVTEPAPTPPVVKEEPKVEPVIKQVTESDFVTVYFDYDKYNLVDSAKSALDLNARIMKENPNLVIKIEGHCDERGTVEYNLSLGEKRASSSKQYLTALGIDGARIQTVSYGKEKPVAFGHDDGSWSKNRRCEFRIIAQ
jgi:peptidoglycan-associated lipoprotein